MTLKIFFFKVPVDKFNIETFIHSDIFISQMTGSWRGISPAILQWTPISAWWQGYRRWPLISTSKWSRRQVQPHMPFLDLTVSH